jgi:hypothetical protein
VKPVNLNKARKARAKVQSRAKADENAIKFGRSKAEKAADSHQTVRTKRGLDGKSLDSAKD